jgi:hypothetical protein
MKSTLKTTLDLGVIAPGANNLTNINLLGSTSNKPDFYGQVSYILKVDISISLRATNTGGSTWAQLFNTQFGLKTQPSLPGTDLVIPAPTVANLPDQSNLFFLYGEFFSLINGGTQYASWNESFSLLPYYYFQLDQQTPLYLSLLVTNNDPTLSSNHVYVNTNLLFHWEKSV